MYTIRTPSVSPPPGFWEGAADSSPGGRTGPRVVKCTRTPHWRAADRGDNCRICLFSGSGDQKCWTTGSRCPRAGGTAASSLLPSCSAHSAHRGSHGQPPGLGLNCPPLPLFFPGPSSQICSRSRAHAHSLAGTAHTTCHWQRTEKKCTALPLR